MARIFLCHAREDKAQVREVYYRLRAIEGFEPWLDEEDLLPGQEWAREIPRALQTSDFILIFLSKNSVAKRGYVQREMKLALDAWQELPEGTIHTIPVRIDACEVPESFRRYHWANLFEPNGFDRIVRAIRAELTKRHGMEQEPSAFTNSIGMEFVLIPAGTFLMGSPESDRDALPNEKPAHSVTISQPFYLGKYQVTQTQWDTVMDKNPSQFINFDNQPVDNVSWYDALAFLHQLNELEEGRAYGMPTEAQWEYACRSGTKSPRYHPNIDAIAWSKRNSADQPHSVGLKLPNAWGLYDMLGNLLEWCHDGMRKYTMSAVVDPMRPIGAKEYGVPRGGSWDDPAWFVRAASRVWPYIGNDFTYYGLRCACSGRRT